MRLLFFLVAEICDRVTSWQFLRFGHPKNAIIFRKNAIIFLPDKGAAKQASGQVSNEELGP